MAGEGDDLTELPVIIVPPSRSIGEVGISFIDLDKLLLGIWIGSVLGMVLQSKISVGPLNFLESCVLRYTQNLIIRAPAVRVLLLEEIPLT